MNFGNTRALDDFSQMTGTPTGSAVLAGNIGEEIEQPRPSSNAVSLSTGIVANVCSITLSGGDWDVEGSVTLSYLSATQSGDASAGIGINSTTIADLGYESYDNTRQTTTTSKKSLPLPRQMILLTLTTPIYLCAKANFSAGTCTAFGVLTARRRR